MAITIGGADKNLYTYRALKGAVTTIQIES